MQTQKQDKRFQRKEPTKVGPQHEKKPRSKQIVYDSNIIRKYYIDKAKKLIKENIRNLLKRDDLISMGSVRVRTLAGEGQTQHQFTLTELQNWQK